MEAVSTAPTPPTEPAPTELWRRYLQAQLRGDRREALRLVVEEGRRQGLSVRALQEAIQRAQREIGLMWQRNEISIAQEHMATAISQVVLARLFEDAPSPARVEKKVLIACVEGEQHDLPARLVSDYLELAGFQVRYLGANVPTKDLLRQVEAERPDLVALSVTMSFNVPSLRDALRQLRQGPAAQLPLLIGGHALEWSEMLAREAKALGVHTSPPDPDGLVQTVQRLLEVAPS